MNLLIIMFACTLISFIYDLVKLCAACMKSYAFMLRYKQYIEKEKCMEFIRREMNAKEENTILYFNDKEKLWRLRCYRFFEIPNSSKGAKVTCGFQRF